MDNILIVAAHPDDDILGCGGLIAKYLGDNKDVHVVFMTDGTPSLDTDKVAQRRAMASDALLALGSSTQVRTVTYLGLEDQQLQGKYIGELAEQLVAVGKACEDSSDCSLTEVYTHWVDDLNEDHVVTAKASLVAFRPSVFNYASIFAYEVPSSSEWAVQTFAPNYFHELSLVEANSKIEALSHYVSELKGDEHPRSLNKTKAQMEMRGSAICVKFAEAFQVLRLVM